MGAIVPQPDSNATNFSRGRIDRVHQIRSGCAGRHLGYDSCLAFTAILMALVKPARVFLSAEWRDLAMLNYAVAPDLLKSFVPKGTELDDFGGKIFISLVGFRFLNTKVRGVSWPFHRNFDEVNLRFYVRRRQGGSREWRRGVVFVREIVPRRAIALAARIFYNEKYIALPMAHHIEQARDHDGRSAQYQWTLQGQINRLSVSTRGLPAIPRQDSEAHFITEHFWGYSSQPDGGSVEFHVDHPSWAVWNAVQARFEGDGTQLYGQNLAAVLQREPDSAFLAEGSAVTVFQGRRI